MRPIVRAAPERGTGAFSVLKPNPFHEPWFGSETGGVLERAEAEWESWYVEDIEGLEDRVCTATGAVLLRWSESDHSSGNSFNLGSGTWRRPPRTERSSCSAPETTPGADRPACCWASPRSGTAAHRGPGGEPPRPRAGASGRGRVVPPGRRARFRTVHGLAGRARLGRGRSAVLARCTCGHSRRNRQRRPPCPLPGLAGLLRPLGDRRGGVRRRRRGSAGAARASGPQVADRPAAGTRRLHAPGRRSVPRPARTGRPPPSTSPT